ncbi:MAG: hydrogenase formation protein HypD [Lentisphaerae bacterium RIFOXYB12_FULL_65_16]|nr:MAG: hydrogenase formation protein HypD [Lentisphaerae bacterium RIFOXYB12_FULL_65_16]
MEVCGTHTVALLRTGVRSLLPEGVRLISGPGCPVCVTAQGYIDAACQAAQMPGVTICTYGDMVRVPGCGGSLAERRAAGARVVVVYSARDALRYAEAHPDTTVVFLAVGFETTAPATAAVVLDAAAREIPNFVVLTSHKLVIPAMRALLSSGDVPIDGFLCPGHVSVIIGAYAYTGVAREFGKSCVIAGFEPAQMLDGILHLVQQRATGRAEVENVYGVAVTEAGNRVAWRFVDDVFETADAEWRALGVIPGSGLTLRAEFARFDAAARLGLETRGSYEPAGCRCGDVLQGRIAPQECPLFGRSCTPTNPVGPCMVSSEGTCAAHYKYGGAVTGVAWEARGLTAPEPPSKGRH